MQRVRKREDKIRMRGWGRLFPEDNCMTYGQSTSSHKGFDYVNYDNGLGFGTGAVPFAQNYDLRAVSCSAGWFGGKLICSSILL